MHLYRILYDGTHYFVEADNFGAAVYTWLRHVEVLWGTDFDGTEQPEEVVRLHEGERGTVAVIRPVRERNGIGEDVERKFIFHAVCREHGHVHDMSDAMVFLAKDKALPATLQFYAQECKRLGVEARQLVGVDLLLERVLRYQLCNPRAVKVPDVDQGPAGDAVVRPNVAMVGQ